MLIIIIIIIIICGMDWMYMVRDRDKRWAVVNAAMNIYLLKMSVNFLTSS